MASASPPEPPFVQGESVYVAHPPRALTPAERAVVEHLARALPAGALEQVTQLGVIGTCRCPCGSLQLDPGAAAPVSDVAIAAVGGANPDALTASARIRRRGGNPFRAGIRRRGGIAALHLVLGRLLELELYAGDGVPVGVPDTRSLGAVDVS
ncbi:MAG: hypothetical protein U0Q15_15460 [Kineosporiaceae bacterium]